MTNKTPRPRRASGRLDDVGLFLILTFGIVMGPVVVVDALATYADLSAPFAGAAR